MCISVHAHTYVRVFTNTGAGVAWLSLSSSCWPAGHRQPNQWTHQEASCDSKFLIQFLLTRYLCCPAWALVSKWAYSACLEHISCSGLKIKTFMWACLNPQGKKFLYFQAKAKSSSYCLFPSPAQIWNVSAECSDMINCEAAVRCTSSCNGPGAAWREHVAVMVGLSRCCWWQWCLWEQPQRPSVPCLVSCTEVAGLRSSDITSRSESRYAGLWSNNSVGELNCWRRLSQSCWMLRKC